MDWLDGSRERGTEERSDVEDWRDGPCRGVGAAEDGLNLVGDAGVGVGVAPTVPPTDDEERRLVSLMVGWVGEGRALQREEEKADGGDAEGKFMCPRSGRSSNVRVMSKLDGDGRGKGSTGECA